MQPQPQVAVIDTGALGSLIREAVAEAMKGPSATAAGADEPQFLTVKQAARHLGVSTDTVRRWDNLGHLPRRQFGKVIRYRRADLDALLTPEAPAR